MRRPQHERNLECPNLSALAALAVLVLMNPCCHASAMRLLKRRYPFCVLAEMCVARLLQAVGSSGAAHGGGGPQGRNHARGPQAAPSGAHSQNSTLTCLVGCQQSNGLSVAPVIWQVADWRLRVQEGESGVTQSNPLVASCTVIGATAEWEGQLWQHSQRRAPTPNWTRSEDKVRAGRVSRGCSRRQGRTSRDTVVTPSSGTSTVFSAQPLTAPR